MSTSSDGIQNPIFESSLLGKRSSEGLTAVEIEHVRTVDRLLDGETPSDKWLISISDWCSPILVKETRQALKSKQFTWTFVLLLLAVVCWTFFAIISLIPSIYYFPYGSTLLGGYLFLLIIPTIMIVPNAAYRSMASELDQGTFDVLTISPLSPLKVVTGKLAVAMVQSMIYISALAPCIALTYLLRGVPLMNIGIILGWVCIVSLAASTVGLFLAALNRIGSYSTMLNIIMILLSLFAAYILYAALMSVLMMSYMYDDYRFYLFTAICYAVIMSYVWLFILGAAACIGIAGENYSTSIRMWSLLQSFTISGMFFRNSGLLFVREPR